MRPLVVTCLVLLCGCVPTKAPFKATLQIQKTDGHVDYVDVNISASGPNTSYRIDNRAEATSVVDQLESLIVDLKLAQEQMPVNESPVPAGKGVQ